MPIRWVIAVLALAVLAPAPARALVGKGARPADFTIEDPDGRGIRLSSFAGRVVLVMYEDKAAAEWNAPLKKRLGRDRSVPRTLAVLPVADMRRWRAWPARNFAQQALRKRAVEAGRTLYGDWSGEAAKSLGVGEGTSSIVLIGEDGVVRWAASGRLAAERIDELVGVIAGGSPGRRQGTKGTDAAPAKASGEAPARKAEARPAKGATPDAGTGTGAQDAAAGTAAHEAGAPDSTGGTTPSTPQAPATATAAPAPREPAAGAPDPVPDVAEPSRGPDATAASGPGE